MDPKTMLGIAAAAAAGVVAGSQIGGEDKAAQAERAAERIALGPKGVPADLSPDASEAERRAAIRSGRIVRDLASASVDAQACSVFIPLTLGGLPRLSSEGVQDGQTYTCQYVADALESCLRYKVERGEDAPRLGWWEDLRDLIEDAGAVLPPPSPPEGSP